MSNPTYFLRKGDWNAVLRKQPDGPKVPSAHAIDREYRVLTALHGTDVPVPRPLHYCADPEILGTPFYLMERLEGRVIADHAVPGVSVADRRAMFEAMASAMAAMHRLDYATLGLADFGRDGNHFARQFKRWSQQWSQFRRDDEDNPALDAIMEWLRSRVPDSAAIALCHGDYRIGNLIFHPTQPRVVGVIDWELSTLGHPLSDVAYNTLAWRMEPSDLGGLAGLPLSQLGIPEEDDYLNVYYAQVGSGDRLTDFHRVFARFRAAVGAAGIAARGEAGTNVRDDASRLGRQLSLSYARSGLQIVEGIA